MILTSALLWLSAACAPFVASGGESATESCVVLCEVWQVGDAGVVAEAEEMAEADPNAGGAVRRLLLKAESGTRRVIRAVSPMNHGSEMTFRSQHETPTFVTTMTSGGATQNSFSDFVASGVSLYLRTLPTAGGGVSLQLSLEASTFGEAKREGQPPPRMTAKVAGQCTLQAGQMRMYLFDVDGSTLVVFAKVLTVM